MISKKVIREIQNEIYEYTMQKKGVVLTPSAYKQLFFKFAKNRGISEEDCLNTDKKLAFEALVSKSYDRKEKLIAEISNDLKRQTDNLTVNLNDGKKEINSYIKRVINNRHRSDNLTWGKMLEHIETIHNAYINMFKNIKKIQEDIEKNMEKIKQMSKESIQDPVTSLGSCVFFEVSLSHEQYIQKRYDIPISIYVITLYDFQLIKEKYGANVLEKILKNFSNVIYNNTRSSDMAFRCEDSFIVSLYDTDIAQAELFSEKMLFLLGRISFIIGHDKIKIKMVSNIMKINKNESSEEILKRLKEDKAKAKAKAKEDMQKPS